MTAICQRNEISKPAGTKETFGGRETLKTMTVWGTPKAGGAAMANQRTDHDVGARHDEMEDARAHDNEVAAAALLGVLVMITAISSAFAVWMTN